MKYINYPEKYKGRIVYTQIMGFSFMYISYPFFSISNKNSSKLAFSSNATWNLCFLMTLLMSVENEH